MKNWHSGMNAFEALECAIQFLDEKDINIVVHSSYLVSTDSRLVKKLKKIPISSKKITYLDLAGKNPISEDTTNHLMSRLFGDRSDVVCIDPTCLAIVG
ncbi:hypothetical protein PHMEG_00029808 [Phytophthora megakarya]|uniref:Uncharacterized protein n=1 Tax=Phytophthora megakarya TaxID=4795 RepID=A0A225V3A7_9STRA|nr:hypothetical protein PHMEG_00029808 [Phytophthora megakarya]